MLQIGGNLAAENGWIGSDSQLLVDFPTNNQSALRFSSAGANTVPSVVAGHKDNGLGGVPFPVTGSTIAGGGGAGNQRNFADARRFLSSLKE
jgi:hypothetical protein